MEYAPIQPVALRLRSISVTANESYLAVSGQSPVPPITMSAALARIADPRGAILVQCDVTVTIRGDLSSTPLPYTGGIRAVGVFAAPAAAESDYPAIKRMVAFNGLAMVYGLARDGLLAVTSLGAHGPFILPSVNLSDFAQHMADSADVVLSPLGSQAHPAEDQKPEPRSNATRPKATRARQAGAHA